jgi:hypothetical protein
MGLNDTWEDAKKMLSDKNFLQCLIMYDKEHMHPQLIKVLKKKYTENPETQSAFDYNSMKKISSGAAVLSQWVSAVISFATICN